MTNGEKIKQIFPGLQADEGELEVYMWTTAHDAIDIPLEWWNAEYKEPTTKNCRTCRNQGSHNGVCDICKKYSCWTEIEPTAKNDLEVDCISRKAVQTRLKEIINEMETIFADIREREVNDSVCGLCEYDCDHGLDGFANECPGFEKDDCFKLNEKYKAEWLDISNIPSVTPQEPQSFKWCTDCKEYDQEKHCCHRYSKVIRGTVAEIRQEPVLDKVRAEIEQNAYPIVHGVNNHEKGMTLYGILQIIDKYNAESEN